MNDLKPNECRVLGVLIEKALTTPAQYPLSLNGVTVGCNQKSNRHPVVNFTEDDVIEALTSLRAKGLSIVLDMSSSRVLKYKHNTKEILQIGLMEVIVLAELLLRGPQTVGEIRTRASRMRPIENLDAAHAILEMLMQMQPPLVKRLPPLPGSRADRYMQLLCETLHPLDQYPAGCVASNAIATETLSPTAFDQTADAPALPTPPTNEMPHVAQELTSRVKKLEQQVQKLHDQLAGLANQLGENLDD